MADDDDINSEEIITEEMLWERIPEVQGLDRANTYLFGTAFHGANMTPYFNSGFTSANITNDSGGVIPPFTSVLSGQTYTTGALYPITTGQIVTFTLTVTYSSQPSIILTLAFLYDGRS